MELKHYIYLVALALLFLIFLIFGLNRKLAIRQGIKYIIPSVVISGAIFLMFEFRFVEFNIWKYNPDYLSGIFLFRIPLEEWLVYIVLPLTGYLVYELVHAVVYKTGNPNYYVVLSLILLVVFIVTTYTCRKLTYTFVIFLLLSVYFGYIVFRGQLKPHYGFFYISFLFSLVPFFFLNAFIVGLPVILYNPHYISGVSVIKIPLENIAGFFLLFLMNISIYEYLMEKRFY